MPGEGPEELSIAPVSHELLLRELGQINSELAAQRRLCAEVVHDLANPVQVVLGLSELLLEERDLGGEVRTRLDQLHRSARTMSALVGDLAQGFGLEDHQQLLLADVELADTVTSVVERSQLLAEARGIALVLEVPPGEESCVVSADAVRIERALGNLIGNAVKFSPTGTTVTVSLTRDDAAAQVGVRDEGPGISEAAQRRIFEVFHREPATAHLPGLGLGLFITQRIARGHGGDVRVFSEPGRGATFVLELPLRDAAELVDSA